MTMVLLTQVMMDTNCPRLPGVQLRTVFHRGKNKRGRGLEDTSDELIALSGAK